MVACPSCGSPVSETARFCATCGKRLPELPAWTAPQVPAPPPAGPQATPFAPPAYTPPPPPAAAHVPAPQPAYAAPPPAAPGYPGTPPPYAPAPPVAHGRSPLPIVALLLVGLLAIGGGLMFGPQLIATVTGRSPSPSASGAAHASRTPSSTRTKVLPTPRASGSPASTAPALASAKPTGTTKATPTPTAADEDETYATPEAALEALVVDSGFEWAGECPGVAGSDVTYCYTYLGQRTDGTRVYELAQVGSEYEVWVLLDQTSSGRWEVVDFGPMPDTTPPPV